MMIIIGSCRAPLVRRRRQHHPLRTPVEDARDITILFP
jgi:hypothetical protein